MLKIYLLVILVGIFIVNAFSLDFLSFNGVKVNSSQCRICMIKLLLSEANIMEEYSNRIRLKSSFTKKRSGLYYAKAKAIEKDWIIWIPVIIADKNIIVNKYYFLGEKLDGVNVSDFENSLDTQIKLLNRLGFSSLETDSISQLFIYGVSLEPVNPIDFR